MPDPIVRPAHPIDAAPMAALLNAIIEEGGTTAIEGPVAAEILRDWMAGDDAWHVADLEGELLGFQWIGARDHLPPEACDIATFVAPGRHGLGIGSRLFEATENAARSRGYAWINATIRRVNTGGQAYYRSRGFEIWREEPERILRRYDL